ncbi:hypothetical protein [Pelovirga terrestris]|uniref:Uncharacterized protein n=1 Tax=Pelovirga terrestris TaxID=2771352 RepID=A0A8J6UIE1_9BACT|nr:hypothetical protein [Pelovirga terrestris]MBD1400740.1 hypothetical protein [Pelovirga terrestris]
MHYEQIAQHLVDIYQDSFGGKPSGRYRISMKHLRRIAGHRRVFQQDLAQISKEMYQLGYSLIDMESFCVVINHKTFVHYRRYSDVTSQQDPDAGRKSS